MFLTEMLFSCGDFRLDSLPDEVNDIFDFYVPLANVPQTGDVSIVWYMVVIMSAMGLLCLRGFDKKKRQEI